MDELVCPRCKTTKYRNPYLKLLVNACGHALCDSCVELLFVKGSAACPECGVPLRRGQFRAQLFEDAAVEREVDIRRRLLKDFNKSQADFPSLRMFNDYLEEIETIIFNLVNNIDILETNKKIEQYKKDNREQIMKSKARPHPELLELEAILQEEKFRSEQRRYETVAAEREEKLQKIKTKENLIDELMFSDTDAVSIIATHKLKAEKESLESVKAAEAAARKAASEVVKKPGSSDIGFGVTSFPRTAGRAQFSTGISTGGAIGNLLPLPKKEEGELYTYVELSFDLIGPSIPDLEELKSDNSKYLSNVKAETIAERAGGFHSSLACRRALQDAYSAIAFPPKASGVKYLESEDFPEAMDESD